MGSWVNTSSLSSMGWVCGYCGKTVGGDRGYYHSSSGQTGGELRDKFVYICPHCDNPTAFIKKRNGYGYDQYPGAVYGSAIDGLPSSVDALYSEVRRCVQYTAYTSAVLSMRKLLMHVAVDQGAREGESFAFYVGYLEENHWIPPNGKEWVDAIRKGGNEANHEIAIAGETQAKQLLDFVEMLLKFVYEFPSKLRNN